jgi:hypothetical protein
MSRPDPTGPLLVAAVQGIGPSAQLWVGNQVNGLKPTGIRGVTTRPSFDSGHREVWVGVGSRLVRVTLSPSGSKTGSYSVPVAQPPAATLRAVRMSPDGARLAVVVDRPQHDAPALLIGSIVRGTGPVRVDSLIPISPLNATIVDVAWLNSVRLFAIGSTPGSRDSLSFDTGVDGTDWTPRPVGLSSPPDSVTVTNGAIAWLSAGGFVWEQNAAGQWVSPTGGQTPGTAPIYLE